MKFATPVKKNGPPDFAAGVMRWLILVGFCLCLGLFFFNTLTRTGRFPPDGMNYVNVARNIATGKGITQPTLGFNQKEFSVDERIPTPLAAQVPLYPLLIALLSRLGISFADSALLLSAFAYGAVFLLIYKLAVELYDKQVALAAVGVLLFYYPLRKIGETALADGLGTFFVFLSFWLLLRRRDKKKKLFLVLTGFVAGLAFATRYALLPVIGVIVLFLLIEGRGWRGKWIDSAFCAVGFLVPAGLIWSHNLVTRGSIMPSLNPAQLTLVQNLISARMLFERYLVGVPPRLQIGLLALTVVVFCSTLIAKHEFIRSMGCVFCSNRRHLLILWILSYFVFLVLVRSHTLLVLEERFLVPVGVAMLLLWSALAVRATLLPTVWISSLVLGLVSLAIWSEALVTKRIPPLDFQQQVHDSERLTWLANHTSDADLIIGNDVVDIPFYLNRAATMSFSTFPYTEPATYDKVVAYARKHCTEYRNIYIVLRAYEATEGQWRQWYGDFFADLVFGHLEDYPDIVMVRSVRDGYIFQITCL